jgi:hypothetical protein
LEIEIPSLDFWDACLADGWHRLAASLYRKDRWIPVTYGGAEDRFFERFPKRRLVT